MVIKAEPKYARDVTTWLQWAEVTHRGAQTLFHAGDPLLWFPAAILGHQALEMYLKAVLIKQGHAIVREDVWGHDLRNLAAKIPTFPYLLAEKLQMFNDYFNELRYPAELVNVMELSESECELLDALVEMIRPYAK